LLVPATMRILGDWNWWPGGRKKSVFKAPGLEDAPPEARPSPPQGERAEGEQRREDRQNVSRRGVERQEVTEDGYLQRDGARQEGGRRVGRPERWGVRPRSGRSYPNHPFLSPDREVRRAIESVDGERAEPELGQRVDRAESQAPKPRPGRAHLDGLFRSGPEARHVAELADGERKTDEGVRYPWHASQEERDKNPEIPPTSG
ncbi:MAG: hypothetical protein M3N18_00300, partial [Actinomycetota bacterium]|nr:hypothetical protein [Actinomycetota bacterium]